ncbi:CBS domain-containing protein [Polymorphospora sp. NPDC051019]|uniref:CBS domain-containing protein n=1 Tax=Polymorphospora sp. NPDC051019 TaxID=3155725 RepID=UPI00343985F8
MRTWQVRDVMTTDVVAVAEEAGYRRIVDAVAGRRVSGVPVVDLDRRVVGVVSESDLLHRAGAGPRRPWRGRRKPAGALTARDLMTAPAVTTYGDTTLVDAARRMDRERVRRLPVVDDLGRLVGIVTRGDLLRVHLRPDEDIRVDVVREVLHRILALPDVRVEVRDGVVTLAGPVPRRASAVHAVRLAGQVGGVVRVVDRLHAAPAPAPGTAATPVTG